MKIFNQPSRTISAHPRAVDAQHRWSLASRSGGAFPALGRASGSTRRSIARSFEPLEQRAYLASIWIADAGGNWNDPNNWMDGTIPTIQDDVVIAVNAGSATVVIDTGAICNSITCNAGLVIRQSGGGGNIGSLSVRTYGTLSQGILIQSPGTTALSFGTTFTIQGASTWNGGTILGTNPAGQTSTLELVGNSSLVVNTTVGVSLTSALLSVTSNVSMSGGTLTLAGGSTMSILDGGELDFLGDSTLAGDAGGTATVTTSTGGSIRKFGTTTTGILALAVANNGAITVHEGELRHTGGTLTCLGTLSTDAGSIFRETGTLNLSSTGVINNLGELRIGRAATLAGGTVTVTGTLNNSGLLQQEAMSGNNPTLTLNTNQTIGGTFGFRGTLNGSGDATFTGTVVWDGNNTGVASAAGSGAFIIAQGATATISASVPLGGAGSLRNITNSGTLTWSSGTFGLDGAVTITNTATGLIDLGTNGSITSFSGGIKQIVNSGTVRKSGSTTTGMGQVRINGAGAVQVLAGTLNLGGNDTFSGTVSVATGATLGIGGVVTFASGSLITSAGTILLGRGVGGGNYNFAVDQSIGGVVTLNDGNLQGLGNVLFTGTFNWLSGNLAGTGGGQGTPGRAIIESGATANCDGGNGKSLSRTLEVRGTLSVTSLFGFSTGGALLITPAGVATITSSASFATLSSGRIDNQGTLNVTSTGTLQINSLVNNTGTLNLSAGTLNLNGTVSQISGNTLSAGAWNVTAAPGATVTLAIFNANVRTIAAGAAVSMTGAGATFNGLAALNRIDGSLALAGGRDLPVTPFAGTLTSAGSISLGAGSTLAITGAFVQTATGAIISQIAGTSPATGYGGITATSAATLAGSVAASFVGGFTPAVATGIDLVSAPTVSGEFATANLPAVDSAFKVVMVYPGNAARLFYTFVADFNNDGVVNSDDLSDFITGYFDSPSDQRCDFNGDSVVNADDLGDYITAFFG